MASKNPIRSAAPSTPANPAPSIEIAITHLPPYGNPDLPELGIEETSILEMDRFNLDQARSLAGFSRAPSAPSAPSAPARRQPTAETVDAWGSRVGTLLSLVNRLLLDSTEPLSMKQICIRMQKYGTDTYYNHMRKLINLGLVEKVNGGYQATAYGRELAK